MLQFGRYLIAIGVVLLLSPIYMVGASSSAEILAIYSTEEDKIEATYLRDALKDIVHRESSIVFVETLEIVLADLRKVRSAIIVLEWPRGSKIPSAIRERIRSLGPTPPRLMHIVSRKQYGLKVSLSKNERRTLMNRRYGLFTRGSSTEEDALNLFRAIDVYPCPQPGECRNYNLDEQVQYLLQSQIHAFFLTTYCPNAVVESVQNDLGDDFDLVGIPPDVVEAMQRRGTKPYTKEAFDPKVCRYPLKKGRTETAGVPGLYAAHQELPSDIARDVATALRARPPVNPNDFVRVIRLLDTMLPLHTDARRVYETRR
jgi:hypothetical protein